MIADWFVTMIDRSGFAVTIYEGKQGHFELSASDTKAMVGLLLQRQRHLHGLSLAAAAKRLGAKSRNAYARYEQGSSMPTVEKLDKLLQAVSGGRDFVLSPSAIGDTEQEEQSSTG